MSFAEVLKRVQAMDFEVVVFDTAPTGHTLRLLQFPTALEKGLGKLAELRDLYGGSIGQMARLFGGAAGGGGAGGAGGLGGLLGSDGQSLGDAIEQLSSKLDALRAVVSQVNAQFRDPDLTTFVAVCIPEFLSLYETERLVQELARFDIDCRNIVINQILWVKSTGQDASETNKEGAGGNAAAAAPTTSPPTSASRLLLARSRMQKKYLDQFDELYEDFHIVKTPLLEGEVRGVDGLRAFGAMLIHPYGGGVMGAQGPDGQADDQGEEGRGEEAHARENDAASPGTVAMLRQRIKDLEEEVKELREETEK